MVRMKLFIKISELISANLRRKIPEVEVIMLFGPTGVGKIELGKNLSVALERLTGKKYGGLVDCIE